MANTTETSSETHSGEAAHASTAADGGKEVFPPMDTAKYPSQIFWLIVFFGLLYWLMKKILPKIGEGLAARKARIDGDIARAQALKDETESAVKAYEKSLAEARSKANDIAKETRETVTREIDGEIAKVNASLAAKISDAEQQIGRARNRALESVEAIAAEAAKDIVTSLTGGLTAKPARKAAKA
jgi:F-type H+-transporting ATPase subunit b